MRVVRLAGGVLLVVAGIVGYFGFGLDDVAAGAVVAAGIGAIGADVPFVRGLAAKLLPFMKTKSEKKA